MVVTFALEYSVWPVASCSNSSKKLSYIFASAVEYLASRMFGADHLSASAVLTTALSIAEALLTVASIARA